MFYCKNLHKNPFFSSSFRSLNFRVVSDFEFGTYCHLFMAAWLIITEVWAGWFDLLTISCIISKWITITHNQLTVEDARFSFSFYGSFLSQSQGYFTTGGLPPISSFWRQSLGAHDQRFFFPAELCGNSPYITSSLTRKWICLLCIRSRGGPIENTSVAQQWIYVKNIENTSSSIVVFTGRCIATEVIRLLPR
jgi:hypothetical protein